MDLIDGKRYILTREALEQLSREELIDIILALSGRVIELEKKIASLYRDSQNSSKPPSSDLYSRSPHSTQEVGNHPKKQGPPKGHPGHSRERFEEVDKRVDLYPDVCSHCNRSLEDVRPIMVQQGHQVVELIPAQVIVKEYLRHQKICPDCHHEEIAPLPEGVLPYQLLDPGIQALIALLKIAHHFSIQRIVGFFQEFFGLTLSEGTVCNVLKRFNGCLEGPYQELMEAIRRARSLYIDETGWRESGKKSWLWVFCNEQVSFFTIEDSRGSLVIKKFLTLDTEGEPFGGTIISDCFTAYNKIDALHKQKCLGHISRELVFCSQQPEKENQEFAWLLKAIFYEAMELWKQMRATANPDEQEQLQERRVEIEKRLDEFLARPWEEKPAARLAKRLRSHREAILYFLEDPTIEYTNNQAERALRHGVVNRKVTYGNRSKWGKETTAKLLTVISCCKKQGRSALEIFKHALLAYIGQREMPSLLPLPP